MGSNPTVTAIVMSRDIVPDRTHKITIFVGSFIYRRLSRDAQTIRGPMISDTQWGHWFSRPGGKTLCLVQEGAKWLSFVLKRQIALFKKHSEKPGNYVLNIEQFAEPTLLRAKRVEVGTISRFIREQCLDSGGNYVLNYDTTVTANLMSKHIANRLHLQPELTHSNESNVCRRNLPTEVNSTSALNPK